LPDHEHAETRDKPETHDDKRQPEADAVTPAGTGFPIVGLGASAGGLEAFNSFFDNMPPDSGMAFVLVMHLAPDRESRVAELLERQTEMAIHPAREGMRVEPNNVYVIQPDNVLTIGEGVLHVTAPAPPREHRNLIDDFFCSLAAAQGRNAICIVLSGTGTDGTRGLCAIKELGGITMTQSEARYGDMPHSAHATGLGDYSLPVEQMPASLCDYAAHIGHVDNEKVIERLRGNGREQLGRILAMLRSHTGHDFSHYKETTIIRRIERRIQVTQKISPDEYLEHLRETPGEIGRLFGDMLIGVTQFMRDEEVFEALESKVVPALCAQRSAGDTVRVWVPGCASGEEAYSLAILFLRETDRGGPGLTPQVFATDIDSKALDTARAGIYPQVITAHLTEEQLERYFRKHGQGYGVVKRLRETCIFLKHDLIRDPPFSRLDMISCRNVLIYMNPILQQRLIPIFHYALRAGGVLLLGPSETITGFEQLFEPIDHKQRLFRRRDVQVVSRFDFSMGNYGDSTVSRETGNQERQRNREMSVSRHTERYLLEQYAPSCVVVDSRYEAVYFSGDTGQYLQPPPGAPDNAVLNMVRHGLKNHLRQALDDAVRTQQPVVREDVHVRTNGAYKTIRLRVRPIPRLEQQADYYAVIFESCDQQGGEASRPKASEPLSAEQEHSLVQQLEAELASTRRHLRATTEDMESSTEALKPANEELMSSNEELQTSAEELDTSKEELQSVNEELSFANEELRRNNDQLSRANSDIKNLFDNTRIAMMSLDKRLNIRSLTPRMSDLYNLLASDTGRSIMDIRARHDYTEFEADVKRVLDTLAPVERRVSTAEGEYMLRILPYQTLDGRIDGAVVTFFDITTLTRARADIEQLTEARARRAGELEAMLSVLPVGVLICADAKSGQVRTNRMGADILGVAENAEISGQSGPPPFKLLRDDKTVASAEFPLQRVLATGDHVRQEALSVERADGVVLDIEVSAWPVKDDEGALRGAVGVFTDVTERKRQLDVWKAQQSALSALALFAFGESDVAAVLRQVVTCLCEVLDSARCEVWRLHAERNELVLEATSVEASGDTKTQAVPADAGNLFGYTLASELPVVIEDAAAENRFAYPSHLRGERMVRGLSVAVRMDGGLWGVLGVHDHRQRKFMPYDTNFMQSVADLLGGVLRRKALEIGHGEAQRRQAFAEAEDRVRQAARLASLGTLAAGIAHEVNNPLNSILMNAELGIVSLQNGSAHEKLPRLLDRIIKEARRGGAITRNVLQFSKADRFTPKGLADLNNLILRARDYVAPVLQDSAVELEFALDPALPRIELNQIALEQAMVNLINNAAQSGASKVKIKTEREQHYARVTINDDGRGIPETELQYIFDPFYTTRRSQGGSGLGLSLVHRIIADHDGTVEARSTEGKGTQFILRLPLGDTDA